jgi:hypothetical protein
LKQIISSRVKPDFQKNEGQLPKSIKHIEEAKTSLIEVEKLLERELKELLLFLYQKKLQYIIEKSQDLFICSIEHKNLTIYRSHPHREVDQAKLLNN